MKFERKAIFLLFRDADPKSTLPFEEISSSPFRLNTEFLLQPLYCRFADIAKAYGTLLGINTDKLKKGTRYEWAVSGEPGAAYRFVVTNSYNAQFQNIVLTFKRLGN